MRRFLGFAGLGLAFLVVLSWIREDERQRRRCEGCDPIELMRRRGTL